MIGDMNEGESFIGLLGIWYGHLNVFNHDAVGNERKMRDKPTKNKALIPYRERKYDIIFINDDEYLYTNTIEFYHNSNSITYFNSN